MFFIRPKFPKFPRDEAFFMRVNKTDFILETFKFHRLNSGKFTYISTHVTKLKPVTPSVGLGDGSMKRCSRFGKQADVCKVKHTQWPRFCAYTIILEKDLYAHGCSRLMLLIKPRNTSCIHQLGSDRLCCDTTER